MKYTADRLKHLGLESGDIFSNRGNFPLGNLQQLVFTPQTDQYHFGLVWQHCDDGWQIIESVNKGIAVGYLHWYENTDIKFYRVNCEQRIRELAPDKLAVFGRCGYDYRLFFRILVRVLHLEAVSLKENFRFTRLTAEEMPEDDDNEFICTEGVAEGYRLAGFELVRGLAIPSAFRQAEIDGRMKEITF